MKLVCVFLIAIFLLNSIDVISVADAQVRFWKLGYYEVKKFNWDMDHQGSFPGSSFTGLLMSSRYPNISLQKCFWTKLWIRFPPRNSIMDSGQQCTPNSDFDSEYEIDSIKDSTGIRIEWKKRIVKTNGMEYTANQIHESQGTAPKFGPPSEAIN